MHDTGEGPPAPRPRRRRRLAAAIRALLAEEGRPPVAARLAAIAAPFRARSPDLPAAPAVLEALGALAADANGPAPADADPAELVARLPGPTPIPPEVCVAVGAILMPLLRQAREKESPER